MKHALNAYQSRAGIGWTRIDLLLALYDGTIERLELAIAALEKKDEATARPLLVRLQLMISAMASGLVLDGTELTTNLLRLFDWVLRNVRLETPEGLREALKVLVPLRESYRNIREDANQLERSGEIPPADSFIITSDCA